MKILSCQVSTHLINNGKDEPPYYEAMYDALRLEGYAKPYHFWEIPNWVAIIAKNFPESDFYIVADIEDTVAILNWEKLDYICFSVLDANKEIIREIIQRYTGTGTFLLGGYIDFSFFDGCKNTKVFPSIKNLVEFTGQPYVHAYDYRHFRGMDTIPRLTLSVGCTHICEFCTESQTDIIESDMDSLEMQIESYRDLNFSLVYLNDKTFGQAENHKQLPELYGRIRALNPTFLGFVIQTTAVTFLKLSDEYLIDSHIRFVELGIETFNDHILRRYHKPSTTKLILKATERFRHLPCKYIPNIIIGFPEETYETYQATLEYLKSNVDVISHLNICNLAIYSGTKLDEEYETLVQIDSGDRDEHVLDKSFHADPGPHHWFSDQLFQFGLNLLESKYV